MKIIDIKCALLGQHPVVRIVTDEGIDGYAQAEFWKPFIKPQILGLRDLLVGEDPTLVERVMLRIRHRGAFKPHGSAISVIETALWDIAGKAAGLPIHRLLGGKVRDRVRVYNGGIRFPFPDHSPESYAADITRMMALEENFSLIKQPIGFHSPMKSAVAGFHLGEPRSRETHGLLERGTLTEHGLAHIIDCVIAMKEVTGDRVALALDCGPGWTLKDALKFARALEPLNIMWLEDLLTGDYSPNTDVALYRELTTATTTPIHTGEQIYLRQNFKPLIETRAVDVIGPDPCDIGGLAELKWVAEFADLYGIQMAPHGTANGLLGLAALIQVSATLPDNFIAFEYPVAEPPWWRDIVEGFPAQIVRDGFVDVPERPGLGVSLIPEAARPHLAEEDAAFFD
ncbi:MAG: mandelate racemase/muconate lactonizing enzyme family protein [Acuticoccus sp.]